MNILNNYDSDEEFSFSPGEAEWTSNLEFLRDIKPFREHFTIEAKIGSGSYCSAYQVRRKSDGKEFCAKNFYPQFKTISGDNREYCDISDHGYAEIASLQHLSHPSILSIVGLYKGRRRGSIYMITELYDTTLDYIIEHHAELSEDEKKCIILQLISVLVYIHSKGYYHCDLKPCNVLYKKGKIAVCDWGSSAREGEASIRPTIGYRPFEMCLYRDCTHDSSLWSSSIDIWALGIITMELFFGEFFCDVNSELTMINRVVSISGNDSMNAKETELFDRLCDACHMKFASKPSELKAYISSRYTQEKMEGLYGFVKSCLGLLPSQRANAKELQQNTWIKDGAVRMEDLPDLSAWTREEKEKGNKLQMELWRQFQEMMNHP